MTFEAEAGRTVADKYELLRLLGRGAMGEVWLARHKTLGEEVALKILKIDMDAPLETSSWRARFQFEAQVAARLSRQTRNIVQVTDHGEDDGASYLVMERLVGESLGAKSGTRLPFALVQRIVAQVAHGLAPAHREGVVHRDLKPDNIFLTKDEEGQLLVKILDFGIARPARDVSRRPRARSTTGFGTVLGTPTYMSPEQSQGLASLDHRGDLWALAVVAYDALAGAPPFLGSSPEETIVSICLGRMIPMIECRPDLGVEVAGFFDRAFTAKLKDRFQTAEELGDAFAALVVNEPRSAEMAETLAPPPSGAGSAPRPHLRARRWVVALALTVAAASASLVIGRVAIQHLRRETRPSASITGTMGVAPSPDGPVAVVAVVAAVPVTPPLAIPLAPEAAPPLDKTARLAPRRAASAPGAGASSLPPAAAPAPRIDPSDVF